MLTHGGSVAPAAHSESRLPRSATHLTATRNAPRDSATSPPPISSRPSSPSRLLTPPEKSPSPPQSATSGNTRDIPAQPSPKLRTVRGQELRAGGPGPVEPIAFAGQSAGVATRSMVATAAIQSPPTYCDRSPGRYSGAVPGGSLNHAGPVMRVGDPLNRNTRESSGGGSHRRWEVAHKKGKPEPIHRFGSAPKT